MLIVAVISFAVCAYMIRELFRAEFVAKQATFRTYESHEATQLRLWVRRVAIAFSFGLGAISLMIARDPEGMASAWHIVQWIIGRISSAA